jgi:S-adenosylmethionine:diacylglycerol 3-amino-3-carboxypropyl transferase
MGSWLLYTTSDEDSESEVRALRITDKDTCLSVTGSGCRTLSLLACRPYRLISVDISAAQNHLLELKLAALCRLSHDEVLAFLGVRPGGDRLEQYAALRTDLSPEAQEYFDGNLWAIETGIVFSGRHETFYRTVVRPLVRLLFGRQLDRLFSARDLDEQSAIYRQIAGPLWRGLIRAACSPFVYRHLLRDPSYYAYPDVESTGDYLLGRLEHTFRHHLARRNHWASFLIYGRYLNDRGVPHYLYRENLEPIRESAGGLEIATSDLLAFLRRQEDASFDKFSLSDVSGWMPEQRFAEVLSEIVRVGHPAGRVCYRNFLTKRPIPQRLRDCLVRDEAMCAQLDREDQSFAFTFEVAEIRKP